MTAKKNSKTAANPVPDQPVTGVVTSPPKKQTADWEAIEREYRAGQLSVRELARAHGLNSHGAILNRAKRWGWTRDLTKRIQAEVVRRIVTGSVTKGKEDEIVSDSANRAIQLIETHRNDIKVLRASEQALLAELQDSPTKLWVGQYRGQVVKETVGIAVTERAGALSALALVMHKRIVLERQAFGIVDGVEPERDPISGIIIEPVAGKGDADE